MSQFTVSSQTLFRITVTVLSLWFLYLVRDVIALLLIAVIITAALGPVIRYFERWRVPRTFIVTAVYVLFFTLLTLLASFIVPMVSVQLQDVVAQFRALLAGAQTQPLAILFGFDRLAQTDLFANIGTSLAGSAGDIFARTASVFSALVAMLATLSMSFYMSLQRDGMRSFLQSVTPRQHQRYVISLAARIQESFGRWMAGQLVTMLFVGTLYFVVLYVLGVPYALVLALLGGILEIIPYLGPVLSVIPAAVIGFTLAPAVGFGVLGGYALINIVENHLLIPQVMHKAVGLNPVLVILALLIGAKVAGLIGVIIAVPIAGAVSLFVKDVLEHKLG